MVYEWGTQTTRLLITEFEGSRYIKASKCGPPEAGIFDLIILVARIYVLIMTAGIPHFPLLKH